MERLKVANDEKLTVLDIKFHTFITLSAKKFLRMALHSVLFSYIYKVTVKTLCILLSYPGRYSSTCSKRIHAKVCGHLDVSEMWIVVLRQHLQLEPGRVLLLRTSRLTLLVSLRYNLRLERPV